MRHTSASTALQPRHDEPAHDDAAEPDANVAREQSSPDGTDADAPDDDNDRTQRSVGQRWPAHRLALLIGGVAVLALGAIGGRLGWQSHHYRDLAEERAASVQAARQGALNLTTIDWHHADADVQRILNSSTAAFYDDFSKRSAPLIDAVKQTQSISKGTIVSAGVQSERGNSAQVLVALKVDVSNAGAAQQPPRSWRMQLTVQKVGDDMKVSDVEFVP